MVLLYNKKVFLSRAFCKRSKKRLWVTAAFPTILKKFAERLDSTRQIW